MDSNNKMKKWLHECLDFFKTLLFFMAIVVLLRVFVFATYDVSGDSMLPNFHDQERLIVSKLSYQLGEPDRFDIVVFHATEDRDFIKRVIGLPGDKIRYENNILYINDQPVEENYLADIKSSYEGQYTNDFSLEEILGTETVPRNHVFVMGDNRPNSVDSRYPQVGFVPYENIAGKVQIRYLPFGKFDIGVGGNQALN